MGIPEFQSRDVGGMLGRAIGEGLGGGLQGGLNQALQQQYQQGRLTSSFNNLSQKGNLFDNLKAIAPVLLTTPGGAQALSELAPLLKGQASNTAYQRGIGYPGENPSQPQPPNRNEPIPTRTNDEVPSNKKSLPLPGKGPGESFFRQGQFQESPESTTPSRTVGPEPIPPLTPPQIVKMANDIVNASHESGNPIPFTEALNTANALNDSTKAHNLQIEQEKQRTKQAQDILNDSIIQRAENSGMVKSEEDKSIARKLAATGRKIGNTDEDVWDYVKSGLRAVNNAKSTIERSFDIPNKITSIYRKLNGTYKEKQAILDDIKPGIQTYKDWGLFDEARELLKTSVGTGAEDTENTIFPFEGKAKEEINKFPENKVNVSHKPSLLGFVGGPIGEYLGQKLQNDFPDERYELKGEKFNTFKEDLHKFLVGNPGANLVALRGNLNQGKKYYWGDVSKAINQLIEEGRFQPDYVQDGELSIINSPPMPGMAQIFDYFLKETK